MKTQEERTFFPDSRELLQVVDEVPVCKRCHRYLPRSTNDPCLDPACPLAYLSLSALWKIIEHRPCV
jgi:hypothetical protein